jgi:hypothetical protein
MLMEGWSAAPVQRLLRSARNLLYNAPASGTMRGISARDLGLLLRRVYPEQQPYRPADAWHQK